MKLLILRLEGVLQSWGEHSKWDERDSGLMPTKSGVLGMISSALGYPRGDRRIEELSVKLHMAVRADRPGTPAVDFQTVQGMPYIFNAEGKKRSGAADTIISTRCYLYDASFLVILYGDADALERCAAALRDPVWAPFLGRKSCVPSLPLIPDITEEYDSVKDALEKYKRSVRSSGKLLVQTEDGGGRAVRMDQITDAASRHFTRRYVTNGSVMPLEVD